MTIRVAQLTEPPRAGEGRSHPIFNAHLDLIIHNLKWASETPDETRTLVAGNIRGAVAKLVDDGVLVPVDEVNERAREAASIAEGMKQDERKASQPVPDELVEAVKRAANLLALWYPHNAQVEVTRLRAALSLPRKTESQVRAEYLNELIGSAEANEWTELEFKHSDGSGTVTDLGTWLRSHTQGEG